MIVDLRGINPRSRHSAPSIPVAPELQRMQQELLVGVLGRHLRHLDVQPTEVGKSGAGCQPRHELLDHGAGHVQSV